MTNSFLTAENVAHVAAAIYGEDYGIASTLFTDASADFGGGRGHGSTILVPVPGATQANTKGIYDTTTALTVGSLTEQSIPVTLSDHVYNLITLSEGDLDLDLTSFSAQVLRPQVRAINQHIEALAATTLKATDVDTTITFDPDKPTAAFSAMRTKLRNNGVPASSPLFAAVSPNVYGALMDADSTTQPIFTGTDAQGRSQLRSGFRLIESNRLADNEVIGYVPTAFALALRAPAVPQGAAAGASIKSEDGTFAIRWVQQYDPRVAVDQSLLSVFAGAKAMPLAVDAGNGTVTLVEGAGAIHLADAA